jgi:phosphoribosyl 1,2-cyclic phosphodiesterase
VGAGVEVTFYGVRGSTPCHGPEIARYGGNTSCVAVAAPGQAPILLDLGTGARYFGLAWPDDVPFQGHCLLSHLHWDHVQGLPFFPPLLRFGGIVELHAPVQEPGVSVSDVVDQMLCPPLFPVGVADLPGEVRYWEHGDETFTIGDARVTSRLIPHIGNTLGYRIDWNGASVAYLSDHQQPGIDVYEAAANALELCAGADLVIHDAQYTRDEFVRKAAWGHCTVEYAIWVAHEAGARAVALFHHDPLHDDDMLDDLAGRLAGCEGPEVLIAREGLSVPLGS